MQSRSKSSYLYKSNIDGIFKLKDIEISDLNDKYFNYSNDHINDLIRFFNNLEISNSKDLTDYEFQQICKKLVDEIMS